MPECVDGDSAQTRDHVISFRCSAEDSLIIRFWMGLDTWMHSCVKRHIVNSSMSWVIGFVFASRDKRWSEAVMDCSCLWL